MNLVSIDTNHRRLIRQKKADLKAMVMLPVLP